MADLVEVSDPDDPRLADYRDLRDVSLRKHLEAEHGLFLAEGEKVVRRAVEAGFTPRSFLMAPRWLDGLADVLSPSDAPCFVVSEALAEQVTGFHVHRGALASLARLPLPSVDSVLSGARSVLVLEDIVDHTNETAITPYEEVGGPDQPAPSRPNPQRSRVALLEDLVDHGNVGSVFRNAAAFGIDAVLVTPRCADPLYRRAIKTSMGNVFNVPWTRTGEVGEALALLESTGYTTVAMTTGDDAISLEELVGMELDKIAFVFGTEGAGVTSGAARLVDLHVRIPMMVGVDSLNVAAATAVTFYATR